MGEVRGEIVKNTCLAVDNINNGSLFERQTRRRTMRINIQNMFWMNPSHSQKTMNQILPASARSADTRKALEQRQIREKAAALTNGTGRKPAETGLENTGLAALSSFKVAKEDVPAAAARKMEEYYQTAGSLTDSITYKEARLKYLKSEYEKISADGSLKHGEKMKELMESEYRDAADILTYTADVLGDSIRKAESVYGKPFGEKYQALLGDIPDKIRTIADSLKGADGTDDALRYLEAAREQLTDLAEELKGRYQEYTGKVLEGYEYRTEGDYADSIGSYGLLWSWDEVTVDASNAENLADYGVDIHNLSAIPAAVSLIDTKA